MKKRRSTLKRKPPLFSHPKHSGKRLPHHHTGYLPLLFLLIFTGFLIVGISRTATADSNIVVLGRIPAPLPPSAAYISSPNEGATFDAIPIEVQGTCPAGYLVKIYRNDSFSGSVICSLNGTFSLQSDLFVGANKLTAHVFNVTDDEGPLSPGVNVTYSPPASSIVVAYSVPDSLSKPETAGTVPQFIIKAESTYRGYIVGDEINWELEAIGGDAPYAFNIDWGDGKSTLVSRKEVGKFNVNHTYVSPGGYKGSYTILIKGSDQNGQNAFVQIFVIINLPFTITSSDGTAKLSKPQVSLTNFDIKTVTTVTYVSLVGLVGSFWLGEAWQLRHLPRRMLTPKHRTRRA